MSLWLPVPAVSLVHQSTNQPEAQKPTWHDRTCASPTWSHRLEKAFRTGLFCNRRAQPQPHFSTLVVLESLSLWLEYRKLVWLVLWPLWTQFSRWTLGSVAFRAPHLHLVAGPAPLPLVQGAFPSPPGVSPFSSVPQNCVLEAVLSSKESTQENLKTAVGPRRIKKKVGIYWYSIKRK